MRREYSLVPNIDTARKMVHELLLTHVPEKPIHTEAVPPLPGNLRKTLHAFVNVLPAVIDAGPGSVVELLRRPQ